MPAPILNTGTYDIASLLAARFTSPAKFGLDTIQQVLENDLNVHNTIMEQMMGDYADVSVDRQRISGTSTSGTMSKVDENGRSATQKALPGTTVGFPMERFQFALGWTSDWLNLHTTADMAIAVQSAQKAHRQAVILELKRGIYRSTNYSFQDYLVDYVVFPVKRFLNADGTSIPDGPNGEKFNPATHSHYLANLTLTNAAADALIRTIIEHGYGGKICINISQGDEAAWRALTGFFAYTDARLTLPSNVLLPTTRLDITRIDNRAIGIYGAAEIWVKPWAVGGYAFAYDGASAAKPLVFRQRDQEVMQGLRLVSTLPTFPLVAEYYAAEFGIGVWNRSNGAVLQFNSATYTDPV
ncbi:hypothetical protein [Deinococcus sp.]|uniref:hypothetical protein n=1 Tax=Deinococcus sp. TaxID=47478 RepID=UPI00286DDD45|nr:hypothetical protein [Deinococcus sp.]